MAFRELEPLEKNVGGGAGPRVTVALALRGKAKTPTLSIGFNHLALAHAGLKIGAKVRLLLGEGDQAGKLRVEAHKDGRFELKGLSGPRKSETPGSVLRIADAAFVHDVRDKRRAEWERLSDPQAARSMGEPMPILGFAIDLPKSFFPIPAQPVVVAVPQPPAPKAASASGANRLPPASRDATATVMGDPPRGRSALSAR